MGRRKPTVPDTIITLQRATDEFIASKRCENPNTRRAYAGVLDRLVVELGASRALGEVSGDEIGAVLGRLWGEAAPSTWNRNRAVVVSWLAWCSSKQGWTAPVVPAAAERRKEPADATKALPKVAIERAISRRDVPLREKTLWRMLYETAARASEVLALNVEDLDLENRQARIRSKGGGHEWVHWGTGTAHLLPRLLRLPDETSRTSGPVFLAHRRPVPARSPSPRDVCPHPGRARLGYDRARILLKARTGWDLHQFRHSAATHLGEKNVPLQLIMAKTRHRSPRTAMRYIKPGPAAVAEVTELLSPPRRRG